MKRDWFFKTRSSSYQPKPKKKVGAAAVYELPIIHPPEYFEWRQNGIGGSDAGYIMDTMPKEWGDINKIFGIKTGQLQPDPPNYQMRRGLRLERFARKEYERETGILMPADRVEHKTINFVRASLDGLNRKLNRGIEIKCPGEKDHAIALSGKIPEKYIPQCGHNCLAGDLAGLDYYSYYQSANGEISTALVPYERELSYDKKLLDKEYPFWESVLKHKNRKEEVHVELKEKLKGPFTAREVTEILQLAKKLGVVEMRLDGFEARFSPQDQIEKGPSCPDCDTEMVPSKNSDGFYCKPCYIERKNNPKGRR